MQHFGFEKDAASIISNLETKIRALTPSPIMRAYIFFRLLGGFVYGEESFMSGVQWYNTTGPIDNMSAAMVYVDGVPSAEQNYVVGSIGLSDRDYRHLRYKVRVQNFICSGSASNEQKSAQTGKYETYMNTYNEATKDIYTDENLFYSQVWGPQMKRMTQTVDFAHFCITVATHLGAQMNKGYGALANAFFSTAYAHAVSVYGVDTTRCYFTGWLGDAVLSEGGKPTSLKGDDFAADADALHFADALSRNVYNVPTAFIDYYDPFSKTSFSRIPQYYSFLDIDQAALVVGKILLGSSQELSASELIAALEGYSQYADTRRFFMIITGLYPEFNYSVNLEDI